MKWWITKAEGKLEISKNKVILIDADGKREEEVRIQRAGDGAISVFCDKPDVVAFTFSESTGILKITTLGRGSAGIFVHVAEGSQHKAPPAQIIKVCAKVVAVKRPTVDKTNFVYTPEGCKLNVTNGTSNGFTVTEGSLTEAVDVGKYYVTYSLNRDYIWDDTFDSKSYTINWEIAPAEGKINFEPNPVYINVSTPIQYVGLEIVGDGDISVNNHSPQIIDVKQDGNLLTISKLGLGDAIVTVRQENTKNYTECEENLYVYSQVIPSYLRIIPVTDSTEYRYGDVSTFQAIREGTGEVTVFTDSTDRVDLINLTDVDNGKQFTVRWKAIGTVTFTATVAGTADRKAEHVVQEYDIKGKLPGITVPTPFIEMNVNENRNVEFNYNSSCPNEIMVVSNEYYVSTATSGRIMNVYGNADAERTPITVAVKSGGIWDTEDLTMYVKVNGDFADRLRKNHTDADTMPTEDNSTKIATTEFVHALLDELLNRNVTTWSVEDKYTGAFTFDNQFILQYGRFITDEGGYGTVELMYDYDGVYFVLPVYDAKSYSLRAAMFNEMFDTLTPSSVKVISYDYLQDMFLQNSVCKFIAVGFPADAKVGLNSVVKIKRYGESGSFNFDNALMIQWGTFMTKSDGHATITFPESFRSTSYVVFPLYYGQSLETARDYAKLQATIFNEIRDQSNANSARVVAWNIVKHQPIANEKCGYIAFGFPPGGLNDIYSKDAVRIYRYPEGEKEIGVFSISNKFLLQWGYVTTDKNGYGTINFMTSFNEDAEYSIVATRIQYSTDEFVPLVVNQISNRATAESIQIIAWDVWKNQPVANNEIFYVAFGVVPNATVDVGEFKPIEGDDIVTVDLKEDGETGAFNFDDQFVLQWGKVITGYQGYGTIELTHEYDGTYFVLPIYDANSASLRAAMFNEIMDTMTPSTVKMIAYDVLQDDYIEEEVCRYIAVGFPPSALEDSDSSVKIKRQGEKCSFNFDGQFMIQWGEFITGNGGYGTATFLEPFDSGTPYITLPLYYGYTDKLKAVAFNEVRDESDNNSVKLIAWDILANKPIEGEKCGYIAFGYPPGGYFNDSTGASGINSVYKKGIVSIYYGENYGYFVIGNKFILQWGYVKTDENGFGTIHFPTPFDDNAIYNVLPLHLGKSDDLKAVLFNQINDTATPNSIQIIAWNVLDNQPIVGDTFYIVIGSVPGSNLK